MHPKGDGLLRILWQAVEYRMARCAAGGEKRIASRDRMKGGQKGEDPDVEIVFRRTSIRSI
jgi:hypothetical protein